MATVNGQTTDIEVILEDMVDVSVLAAVEKGLVTVLIIVESTLMVAAVRVRVARDVLANHTNPLTLRRPNFCL